MSINSLDEVILQIISLLLSTVVYNTPMPCEFSIISMNGRLPVCNKLAVLPEIIKRHEIEDIYTVAQLREIICNSDDPGARKECHAHSNLEENGRSSLYCK